MKRIDRADLRMTIYVAIRTAPKLLLSGLRAKLPAEGDKAAEELAERICCGLDNDHTAVMRIEQPPGIPFAEFCDALPKRD